MGQTNSHYFYVLKCADNSLYAGYAKDVHARLQEHNNGVGAKYTRGRLPAELLYFEGFTSRSEAMKAEYAFKQLTRQKKEEYIQRRGFSDAATKEL